MPFKLNHDRRQHIPRQKHRVTNSLGALLRNSAAYDAALRQRGSLTVWFTAEAIEGWRAAPRSTPGGQSWYSPLAILTGLTLRALFRLALRQIEGLIGSIIGLLGLALAVPDHFTLGRRTKTLQVPRPQPRRDCEPMHLLVDSTGLRLCGAGGAGQGSACVARGIPAEGALAHGPALSDRGERRRPRAQPRVGTRTPDLRPHRLTSNEVGATAPALRVCATR